MTPPRRGRDTELALRQQLLVLRGAELRAEWVSELAPLRTGLSWTLRLQNALAWLRTHPELAAGAVAAAVVLRPGRALRWGLRLWGGWRLWRQLSPLLDTLGQTPARR